MSKGEIYEKMWNAKTGHDSSTYMFEIEKILDEAKAEFPNECDKKYWLFYAFDRKEFNESAYNLDVGHWLKKWFGDKE